MRIVGLVIMLIMMLMIQNIWLNSTIDEPPVVVKVEPVPVMHTLPLR